MSLTFEVALPMPLQIVIDDVGWWNGEDGHLRQEPYRTGIARQHAPQDYAAIISLGRQLGMKPQAAFILCEWDIHNRLRQLPHSTWMDENWDNARWVGSWLDEAAAIMQNGQNYVELTLHGLGHEYWENGYFTRAEWHSGEGVMRPAGDVRAHIEMFGQLLQDHEGLGAMPTSFVPCAFRHRFGGADGFAAIAAEYGVDFISTPFHSMHGREQVEHSLFGFDHGVMTANRGEDLFNWDMIDPQFFESQEVKGPICGMHWPNILHRDPARNEEVVARWVTFLERHQNRLDRVLASDTSTFRTQLAHYCYTALSQDVDAIHLGFSAFDQLFAPSQYFQDEFTLKLRSPQLSQFSSVGLDIISVEQNKMDHKQFYTLKLRRTIKTNQATITVRNLA